MNFSTELRKIRAKTKVFLTLTKNQVFYIIIMSNVTSERKASDSVLKNQIFIDKLLKGDNN